MITERVENDLEFTIVGPFNRIGPRMDLIPGIDGPSEVPLGFWHAWKFNPYNGFTLNYDYVLNRSTKITSFKLESAVLLATQSCL